MIRRNGRMKIIRNAAGSFRMCFSLIPCSLWKAHEHCNSFPCCPQEHPSGIPPGTSGSTRSPGKRFGTAKRPPQKQGLFVQRTCTFLLYNSPNHKRQDNPFFLLLPEIPPAFIIWTNGRTVSYNCLPLQAAYFPKRKQDADEFRHPVGTPDTNRTCDTKFRKLVLYPTELRAHILKYSTTG